MKENYIKSPLNYVGGKYKLLKEILPLFPDKINTFVDLFGGGFNVGINVKAKHIIYNELCKQVVELMEVLKEKELQELLDSINFIIRDYKLSKENKEGFLKLRKYYNENPEPIVFYTMICYAFNNQIRFNQQGKYNMPFGKDRSSFNPTLRKKFICFVDKLHNIDISFMNKDFTEIDFEDFNADDLVYCDPPYFNSVATYNEQNGWTEDNEKSLLDLLDRLNDKGVKFALSNNLKYKNPLLDKWKEKYKVHYLNADYSNCNYHKVDRSKDIEVLITNYIT